MPGLRERKKLMTRAAIHDAAMALYAERGYGATTVADIADAANVSRATFFSYFRGKDDVVFGNADLATRALADLLADPPQGLSTLDAVRGWLRTLTGWLDDERLPLQHDLAREVPSVAARRMQILGEMQDVIATALLRELGGEDPELVAQLVAASLIGALMTAERTAAQRTRASGGALTEEEVDRLLDATTAFIDGGLKRLGAGPPA